MGFWVFILIIIAAMAIESGDITMIVFWGGLAAYVTYLWVTKEERRKKGLLEEQKKREEAERIRKEQVRQRALKRFNASPFSQQIVRDLRSRNWQDLDYKRGGCLVCFNEIVTPCQKYAYKDYDYKDLDEASCEELAEYLGLAYGREYCVEKVTKSFGHMSSSYSGYISSNGDISVLRDCDVSERTKGYKVYSKASVPPAEPEKKSW